MSVEQTVNEAIERSAIAASKALLLDMSSLIFMDSTALHALIRAKEAMETRGVPLVLVGANDAPRRTLEAAGLLPFFMTAADVEHGLSLLDQETASTI